MAEGVRERYQQEIDIAKIDLEDKKTLELFLLVRLREFFNLNSLVQLACFEGSNLVDLKI